MPDQGRITLSIEDELTVDAPRAATMLARELIREGVPVAEADAPPPEGSKSGIVITVGSLIISGALSVQSIRSITQIVLAAMRRGLAGRIDLDDGNRKIKVENASRETEWALIAWLNDSGSHPSGE